MSLDTYVFQNMYGKWGTISHHMAGKCLATVITSIATPNHWAFYFQGSGLPLSYSGTWSGFMHKVHVALQGHQVVALMLYKMVFCYLVRWAALHLENSTVKAYVHNQGGTASPFLCRLPCCILNLANMHGITLIPAYISTHFNGAADFPSLARLFPGWPLLPHIAQAEFQLWGQLEVNLLAFLYQSMSALLHPRRSSTSGNLGVMILHLI